MGGQRLPLSTTPTGQPKRSAPQEVPSEQGEAGEQQQSEAMGPGGQETPQFQEELINENVGIIVG